MNKKDHKKLNVVVGVLCITIITMCIGFIVLAMKLESYSHLESTFDVRFISVQKASSIKGGVNDPSASFEIDSDGKVLNMNFLMYQVHDEIDYEVVIRNEGNVEASIVRLFSSPDFSSKDTIKAIAPISIHISDVSGKLLEPGEETIVKIRAVYNPSDEAPSISTPEVIYLSGKLAILAESKK